MTFRILLADDHKLFREGLKAVLENKYDVAIVAEADNGVTALELAIELRPDIVILNNNMTCMDGIESVRRLKAEAPEIKVIFLSIHADKHCVKDALKAGAKGFLCKGSSSQELGNAIRAVAAGEFYLSPSISNMLVEEFFSPKKKHKGYTLSQRELQVLGLIAEGKNTKEIAFKLEIGSKTVETYRQKLMKKLDMNNVVDLAKYALRTGLTSLK